MTLPDDGETKVGPVTTSPVRVFSEVMTHGRIPGISWRAALKPGSVCSYPKPAPAMPMTSRFDKVVLLHVQL